MKKFTFFFIALLTTSFSVYCQVDKKSDTLDDLGKYVFGILKNFDTTSEQEFTNSLLTVQELKAYAKKHSDADAYDKKIIERIDNMPIEEYNESVIEEYVLIKDTGKKQDIKWPAIKFIEFTSTDTSDGGFTHVLGELIFQHKKTKYSISTEALLLDNKYVPLIIRQLTKLDYD